MANKQTKAWVVKFTSAAKNDLIGIITYLLENHEVEAAKKLATLIRAEGEKKLAYLPEQGRVVPELTSITKEYREIRVKTYRLIYRAFPDNNEVKIFVIAHTRQNIQEMLLKSLILKQ